jgi:hypothetical protein
MTTFAPSGKSYVLAYTDDSTETSSLEGGATALLVFNEDTANVVVVNVGFSDGDTDAVVPEVGSAGKGTVVGPNSQIVLHIPQAASSAEMYVSVAGVSGTGNVFFSSGAFL